MLLYSYACGPVSANMIFVGRDGAKTVAVIDPSDADLAKTVLKEHGWTLSSTFRRTPISQYPLDKNRCPDTSPNSTL